MATFQESQDLLAIEQRRAQMQEDQRICSDVEVELQGLRIREDAGNQILALTKNRPGDAAYQRSATATIEKLANQRTGLETRLAQAKHRIEFNRKAIEGLNPGDLSHVKTIEHLFPKLTGALR
jgi:hypothetical protein